jgi:hypothetical protein
MEVNILPSHPDPGVERVVLHRAVASEGGQRVRKNRRFAA